MVGVLASVALTWQSLGPTDPSRWRVEHLTSLLAAYTIVWLFVFSLYITVLPQAARELVPAVLGSGAILWARQRFGGQAERPHRTPH